DEMPVLVGDGDVQHDDVGAAAEDLLLGGHSRRGQARPEQCERGRASHWPVHRGASTRTPSRLLVTSSLAGGIIESGRPYVTTYCDVSCALRRENAGSMPRRSSRR